MIKHICMITGEFPPISGGLGYYAYNLSKKLVGRGYKVTIFTRGLWNKTYYERMDGIFVYRVRFLPLYPFHLQPHGIFVNRLLRKMESSFDIVHLHNHGIPVIQTSLPTVVTEHGTAKGFIENLEFIDLFSFVEKTFSKMYITMDRKVVKSADKVTAVSNTCADELKMYYDVKDVEVVNNGADTNFFVQIEKENQEDYVLYAGALTTEKGLSDLIRSAEYVCRDYPNIKFILAGKGPLEKHLKNLVHHINMDKNFSFVGYVDQNKLLEYYQNAAVYVLPSYHEGLPTTLLEAMSCGIPTVATDVAGNSEVVVDSETGLLVPPKNHEKLAEAIIKLLGDEKLRKRMGKNGRKRVEECYDWEIIANKFERIYESIKR